MTITRKLRTRSVIFRLVVPSLLILICNSCQQDFKGTAIADYPPPNTAADITEITKTKIVETPSGNSPEATDFPNQTRATDTPKSSPTPSFMEASCDEINITPKPSEPADKGILGNFILYSEADDGTDTYWLAEVDIGQVFGYLSGFKSIAWSPTGSQILLYQDRGIYLASSDGSNVRLVKELQQETDLFGAWWLSENCIIVDVALAPDEPGIMFDPRVHLLELSSGSMFMIGPDEPRITQAVNSVERIWIDAGADGFTISSFQGLRKDILDSYDIVISSEPRRFPTISFLPSGDQIVFVGYQLDSDDASNHIWLSEVDNQQVVSVKSIYSSESYPSSLKVSPNAMYVSFFDHQEVIVLDLISGDQISFKPWEKLQSDPVIVWSPNSQSIAISFAEMNTHKLVVITLLSGKTETIAEGNKWIEVRDWQYISYNPDTFSN